MSIKEQQMKSHLKSLSPANATVAAEAIRYRRNKGCKSGTLVNYAWSFLLLDKFLDGRPFQSVSRHDLAVFVESLRYHAGPTSNENEPIRMDARLTNRVPVAAPNIKPRPITDQ